MRRHSLANVSRRTASLKSMVLPNPHKQRADAIDEVTRVSVGCEARGRSRHFDQVAARERLSTWPSAADPRVSGARAAFGIIATAELVFLGIEGVWRH